MNLRSLICALLGHRYRFVGVVMGQRIVQCERCQKTVAGNLT